MKEETMARYRVGDKYLSENEYKEHVSSNWEFGLFIIGAVITGIVMNKWLVELGLIKEIRFALVIVTAIISGYFTSKLSNIVRFIVGLSIIGFVLWAIFSFIWDVM
ncbi:hypothetical protein GWZ74_04705 [Vibrio cholerae]|uniref:hypothetical protein n=1 Tax=Vibrio cholerae TaxID=666 RepID=UPI00155E9F04|nr:hypothetical protein [Vibrio cholerae]NOE50797.1 hypothetical protein [Vibrio cholerae]NOE61922.1 hypothetical protein [Vibrio cholerae]NOE84850.1 hypothetical protein [Vibrio cholerae]NOE95216.1 hypothetical protein [Vibrio cholerae]NOE99465.1 hypothetical protein [Vibrio cholerae]